MTEIRCTKDDEFRVSSCECPDCVKEVDTNFHKEKDVVLTDSHITPYKIDKWTGCVFVCPKCGLDSIMHRFNYCPNCGLKITIQSHELTNLVKEADKQGIRF